MKATLVDDAVALNVLGTKGYNSNVDTDVSRTKKLRTKKGGKFDFMTLMQIQMPNDSQEQAHQSKVAEGKCVENVVDRKHLTEMIDAVTT